jgi:hypothetical protein
MLFGACGKKSDDAAGGPPKSKLAFPVELVTIAAERVEYTVTAVAFFRQKNTEYGSPSRPKNKTRPSSTAGPAKKPTSRSLVKG